MIRSLSLLICVSLSGSILAANWPCWRGPRGDGTSAEIGIPVQWNGESVYVTFLVADGHVVPAPNVGTPRPVTPGTLLVAAFDMNGQKLWSAEPGEFTRVHGFCSSPVIYRNLLIVNGDHNGESWVAALSRESDQMEVLHRNPLGEYSYASPAISSGQIFIRGEHHLFAIGKYALKSASESR